MGVAVLLVVAVSGWAASGRRPVPSARVRAVAAGAVAADGGRTPGRGVPLDLALAVSAVAAQVRAGRAPASAWSDVLGVPLAGTCPTVADLLPSAGGGRRSVRLRAAVRREDACERAAAVGAACRVADELGAPLADVLDEISAALAADALARADVRAAVAGPRAGARVVAWLPVLGAGLGLVLGADPLGVLVGGGPGTAAGMLGTALLVAGHVWSRLLVARAGRAGR